MKKVLIIASIAVLSATAQAESTAEALSAVEAEQEIISIALKTENRAGSDLIIAASGDNNFNLWKMLDINEDGILSKTETVSSKEVFSSWNKLDSNRDGKLDTEEFAYFFTLEN